mgnify:CR=1 FL=1
MQTLEEKQQDGMTGAGPETEFHTELFGFNRVEVLSYIERISAANAEKARALEDTIAALQKDLTGVRRQGSTLAQKAKQVFNELENQKKRAEDAVAEAAALRTEVDKANDEIAAVRSRLFAREQENAALKSDNARLSETVDDLTRALTRRGAPGRTRPLREAAATRPCCSRRSSRRGTFCARLTLRRRRTLKRRKRTPQPLWPKQRWKRAKRRRGWRSPPTALRPASLC